MGKTSGSNGTLLDIDGSYLLLDLFPKTVFQEGLMISHTVEPNTETLSSGLFTSFFFLFNQLPLKKSQSTNGMYHYSFLVS